MSVPVELIRWIHIIGATVLLGTGSGIAFFMVMAQRTRDARIIAHVASTVVVADWIFTATAVVAQPITGVWLAYKLGWSFNEPWILISLGLYILTGAFWLPVVWIQKELRNMARASSHVGAPLPPRYHRLYRVWFVFGFPAFSAVLAILWLMVTRPALAI